MDKVDGSGTFPASMKTTALAVAFREVRHFEPDDWLHCESIALRGRAMNWTIPAHRHEGLHQFLVLERGVVVLSLDDHTQRVVAPAMLMVAPGCVHALRFEPDSVGQQVTVPSLRLTQALAHAPALAATLTQSCVLAGDVVRDDADALVALCQGLVKEFETSLPGRNEALQAHVVLWATWFLRRAAPVTAQAHRHAVHDTLVQRYRALIELHLHPSQPQQSSVSDYARELAVSSDHLSRVCKTVTGLGALEILHERMLLEARRRLAFSDVAVSAVARELGFEDPSYFSRFFARRAGCSPQGYRRALHQGRAAMPT